MTFKDFKGQVKISDVQKAFDNLVDRINNSIDTYNESSYVTDINYNDVSEELAPLNYTLSVGGLKKILETYDGCVVGCKVFKIENNLNITSGLLIRRNGCIQLPSAVIPAQGKYLFYSPSLKQYKYPASYIYKTSDWTMPNINSNESWGEIDVQTIVNLPGGIYDWSSGLTGEGRDKAYRACTSDGFHWGGINTVQDLGQFPYKFDWSWKFKQPIALKNISFNGRFSCNKTGYDLRVKGYKNGVATELYQLNIPDTGGVASDRQINIDLSTNRENYERIEISFTTTAGRNFAITGYIYGLRVTGETLTKVPIEGSGDATDWIQICKLNYNRDVALSNAYEFDAGNIQNYKITCGNNGTAFQSSDGLDTSSAPKFVSGCEGGSYGGSGRRECHAILLDQDVAYSIHPSESTAGSYYTYPKLLVPKGVANPYTYTANTSWAGNSQKVYKVNIDRK